MAEHVKCPDSSSDGITLGTALTAARCRNLDRGTCKGNGETAGSLWKICEECSEFYGLCEACCQPFSDEHPRA